MTTCLLLELEAPLQSWGYRSRFSDRDTGAEPTKSGVIGLLCCALGRDRSEPVDDLAALKMAVRIDKPGHHFIEFQTAGAGDFRGLDRYAAPKSDGSKGKDAVILSKHYLQDAKFLVALEGPNDLLQKLNDALDDPVWPLYLGRKSCPPANAKISLGIVPESAEQALRNHPAPDGRPRQLVIELNPGDFQGEARADIPLSWPDRQNRKYGLRYVRTETLEPTPIDGKEVVS